MVYFMLFSVQKLSLSASDLFIANSTEEAHIKSTNRLMENPNTVKTLYNMVLGVHRTDLQYI